MPEGELDLSFTEEQRALQHSVRGFLARRYAADRRGAAVACDSGRDIAAWHAFAEQGWTALMIPDAFGGLGLGAIEVGIIAEAFGRILVGEPFVDRAVLAPGLIRRLASRQQQGAWLAGLAAGQLDVATAICEPQCGADIDAVTSAAWRTDDGWRLSGRKSLVFNAETANLLLVVARLGAESRAPLAVFAVPATDAAAGLVSHQTVDSRRAAQLTMDDVVLAADAILGNGNDARQAIEAAVDEAITAMAWETVGCMDALLEATVDYTGARRQFGRPLAANQVVRHRLVQMKVQIEMTRAAALHAALTLDGEDRARAASGAKAKAGEAARFVAEQAIQLHGANGVTDELAIGAYAKRLLALQLLYGSPEFHYARHATLSEPSGGGVHAR